MLIIERNVDKCLFGNILWCIFDEVIYSLLKPTKMKELEGLKEQAFNYQLVKMSIKSYLESYTEFLAENKAKLAEYESGGSFYDEVIQFKKEHIAILEGKIELLNNLNKY
jgi:hypothetical protein